MVHPVLHALLPFVSFGCFVVCGLILMAALNAAASAGETKTKDIAARKPGGMLTPTEAELQAFHDRSKQPRLAPTA